MNKKALKTLEYDKIVARLAELSTCDAGRVFCEKLVPQRRLSDIKKYQTQTLDALTREQLDMQLMDICSKTHKTVIFITHNVGEAVLMSDRVYIMKTTPGEIIGEVRIALERPRQLDMKDTREFAEYEYEITDTIGKIELSLIK